MARPTVSIERTIARPEAPTASNVNPTDARNRFFRLEKKTFTDRTMPINPDSRQKTGDTPAPSHMGEKFACTVSGPDPLRLNVLVKDTLDAPLNARMLLNTSGICSGPSGINSVRISPATNNTTARIPPRTMPEPRATLNRITPRAIANAKAKMSHLRAPCHNLRTFTATISSPLNETVVSGAMLPPVIALTSKSAGAFTVHLANVEGVPRDTGASSFSLLPKGPILSTL